MSRRDHLLLKPLLVFTMISAGNVLAGSIYQVTDLPFPPGVLEMAMNNSGQVLGLNSQSTLIIGTITGYSTIPLPTNCNITQPIDAFREMAISDSGQVVVTLSCPGVTGPYISGTHGLSQIPMSRPPWQDAIVRAINSSGRLVGDGSYVTGGPPPTFEGHLAFAGSASGINPIPSIDGFATDINNAGQVVGITFLNGQYFPFMVTDGSINIIPLPPKLTMNLTSFTGVPILPAVRLNGVGQIIVNLQSTDDFFIRPFFGDKTGLAPIPLPTGCASALATGLNDSGHIIGLCLDDSLSSLVGAPGGLGFLNEQVPLGWNITAANAINNNGQIAAVGINPSGLSRTVMLEPCVKPSDLVHYPGPPYSFSLQPITMNAVFTPTNDGSPISLIDAATACGFTKFNYVQRVTADAHPPKNSAGNLLSVPYSDPPPAPPPPPTLPGGYFGHPDDAYPFYWNQNELDGVQTVYCTTGTPYPPNSAVIETTEVLRFQDCPSEPLLVPTDPPMSFTTSLVGVLPSGNQSLPLYTWSWTSSFNGLNTGGVSQRKSYNSPLPNSGAGGVTITSINGVQLPPIVLPTQLSTTASGLAYSRVTQTFDGTVTLTNISSGAISGPLQVMFFRMPTNVTLTNATANLSGTPFLTVPGGLAPGQSATVTVRFKNPQNVAINVMPVVYSGSLN